jgi:hypothetical protein
MDATTIEPVLTRYLYTMAPINYIIQQSLDPKKRNIVKAYILKETLGIAEGDLFPNQMGDIQNLVDKIVTLPSIIEPSAANPITNKDVINAFNEYLQIRRRAKVYMTYDAARGNTIHIATNSSSPADMYTNIIRPFCVGILGNDYMTHIETTKTAALMRGSPVIPTLEVFLAATVANANTRTRAVDAFQQQCNRLYTLAVLNLSSYQKDVEEGTKLIKLSTHVDVDFLKQEASRWRNLNDRNARLEYISAAPLDNTIDPRIATGDGNNYGEFPTIPKPTIAEACADPGAAPRGVDPLGIEGAASPDPWGAYGGLGGLGGFGARRGAVPAVPRPAARPAARGLGAFGAAAAGPPPDGTYDGARVLIGGLGLRQGQEYTGTATVVGINITIDDNTRGTRIGTFTIDGGYDSLEIPGYNRLRGTFTPYAPLRRFGAYGGKRKTRKHVPKKKGKQTRHGK